MKKLVTILTLSSLMCAGLAFGIADDGINSLGVYFDMGTFEINCIEYSAAVPFDMYCVLAHCTQPTIGGFEFAWGFDPDPVGQYFLLSTALPPNGLNIGTPYNLIVGLGTPLVTSDATVLVTHTIMVLAPGVGADIMFGPSTPASIPGWPAINDGDDPSQLFPLTYSTYWPMGGQDIDPETRMISVGMLGCPGPVATENHSYSNIKALFR